ncbi:hypothetical protein FHS61_001865 [Altererythrobacter atlanticus]|uniref:Uncharacterized protein n=1 Tax=Croceibacterium atlanticum TaxID=1267766 RepID=A0A0F7KLG5_9SPHN|nr:hypothetical protein [Croceibacterium atlanticum]AKH41378.1 hypothetical protein WYH_00315 [Croceibacterium atlanticum]MBB5732839.1 hypothetical protein [Croceibacterium atlanticum]
MALFEYFPNYILNPVRMEAVDASGARPFGAINQAVSRRSPDGA